MNYSVCHKKNANLSDQAWRTQQRLATWGPPRFHLAWGGYLEALQKAHLPKWCCWGGIKPNAIWQDRKAGGLCKQNAIWRGWHLVSDIDLVAAQPQRTNCHDNDNNNKNDVGDEGFCKFQEFYRQNDSSHDQQIVLFESSGDIRATTWTWTVTKRKVTVARFTLTLF